MIRWRFHPFTINKIAHAFPLSITKSLCAEHNLLLGTWAIWVRGIKKCRLCEKLLKEQHTSHD